MSETALIHHFQIYHFNDELFVSNKTYLIEWNNYKNKVSTKNFSVNTANRKSLRINCPTKQNQRFLFIYIYFTSQFIKYKLFKE